MTGFLHGVEIIEQTSGSVPIRTVATAVIGIVGTAPMWAVAPANQSLNAPVVIRSDRDAAAFFGPVLAGYSIPAAIRAAQAQGAATIVVVNVFDQTVHKTVVAPSAFTAHEGKTIVLPDQGVTTVVVTNAGASVTYVKDTDYSLDAVNGIVTPLTPSGAITDAEVLHIGYYKPNPAAVVGADVIGSVDGGGNRLGAQALLNTEPLFGFSPKLLAAPAYSQTATVAAALDVLANTLRAMCLVDAPAGTTVAQAITNRGTSGNAFNSGSKRTILCFPEATGPDGNEPYSQWLSGVIAHVDDAESYSVSPSNHTIAGVIGAERPLTATNDSTSDVNALNAAGIVTIALRRGAGAKVWGNRSAAYPASSEQDTFICVRRTADVVEDAIELAALQYMDKRINNALIDSMVGDVNTFMRTLIQRGDLLQGSKCTFDPTQNTSDQLALGHLTINYTIGVPSPLEDLTFNSFIDISLLSSITGTQGA